MNKIKLYIKSVLTFFGASLKPAYAKDECSSEQLIFNPEKYFAPELKDILNSKDSFFAGYEIQMPAFCVRTFNNAFCFTDKEAVFSENKAVIVEYTSQKVNPFINKGKLFFFTAKKRKIDAAVAHLSLSGLENNYYHFLTECLARLYLVEQSKYKPDYYIIANHLSFQAEFLSLIGIEPDRVISANLKLLIQARTLIVPDFINNWKKVYYRGAEGFQKQWQPKWTANLYKDKIELLQYANNGRKKIHVSRDKANHRKFVNQNEVNEIFSSMGFETYYLEDMTIEQQIILFANAEFVAGLHGAGFANIYFSKKGTKIFEIYTQHYHDSSYRILANSLGLEYSYLIGKTLETKNVHPQKEDVYVDINDLKHALLNFSKNGNPPALFN